MIVVHIHIIMNHIYSHTFSHAFIHDLQYTYCTYDSYDCSFQPWQRWLKLSSLIVNTDLNPQEIMLNWQFLFWKYIQNYQSQTQTAQIFDRPPSESRDTKRMHLWMNVWSLTGTNVVVRSSSKLSAIDVEATGANSSTPQLLLRRHNAPIDVCCSGWSGRVVRWGLGSENEAWERSDSSSADSSSADSSSPDSSSPDSSSDDCVNSAPSGNTSRCRFQHAHHRFVVIVRWFRWCTVIVTWFVLVSHCWIYIRIRLHLYL